MGVLCYERWLGRFGELMRADILADVHAGADDVELPLDASWWEEFLADSLVGLPYYEGEADAVDNPMIPVAVTGVVPEEWSARELLKKLFGALFGQGARVYAGPIGGVGDGPEVLAPYFVVVVEGTRVLYEGKWPISKLVLEDGAEEGLWDLHARLAEAVSRWESGR